ncbi:MAG: xylose isomerase [Chloroflexi bacterium]|nr:MAG: xylose isomerase [Chloroflexota bacterium]
MPDRIKIANAPCSWGVLEFDLEGEAAGYPQVLNEIAETGYVGTELGDWGFMPTDPAHLRAELDARRLDLLAAFVPVAFAESAAHAEGEAAAVRTAQLLHDTAGSGCFIVLADNNGTVPERTQNAGRITSEMGLSDAKWRTFAEGVDRVARAVKEATGLRSVFHHHCAGYIETPAEIERLMALTDPTLVGLCLDTGHCMFGGGDPADVLERYYGRIWHVHFKDFDPRAAERSRQQNGDYFAAIRQGVFCELGQGVVDFPGIRDMLIARGYSGWIVVEQDVLPSMGAPKLSAQRNRDYLRSIGF